MKYIRVLLIITVIVAVVLVWELWRGESMEKEASTTYVSEHGIEIIVEEPISNAIISSPLIVKGLAPGTWYFEATFPVSIVDQDGKVVGESYAQARSDWMTENHVEFQAEVVFDQRSVEGGENVTKKQGKLILHRDNPSGLFENDDSVEIPVRLNE